MESYEINVIQEHSKTAEYKFITCEFTKKHLDLLWNNLWHVGSKKHYHDVQEHWPYCKLIFIIIHNHACTNKKTQSLST